MGDEADRMMEDAAEWADFSEWCPIHRQRYLPHLGPCSGCEDGDPPKWYPATRKETMNDRAPFEPGNDLTIRQLVEKIEKVSSRSLLEPITPTERHHITAWSRTALTIMDRLTSNESAWIDKYHEAKSLGFSDGDAEAHADHAVARLP